MTTLKTFLTAGLLFSATLTWGQNKVTDTTATVVSYWQKGDKARLSFTQTKEKYKNGQLNSNNSSASIIDISIVDATEKSYTINWKYSNIKVNDQQANPLVQKLAKLSEGLVVIYKTDEMGTFKELVNWKKLQNSVYDALDKIAKEFNSPQVDAALNQVKSVYSTKESIEQIVIRDVQLFHSLYGGEYKLKEKIVSETQLPNFLGGDPFPAIVTIEMTELKPKDNYCKIQILQSIDKAKATKVISDWVEKVSDGKSKETKMPTINIDDFSEFEVELITGWVTRAFHKRIVEADDTKNIETYELKKL